MDLTRVDATANLLTSRLGQEQPPQQLSTCTAKQQALQRFNEAAVSTCGRMPSPGGEAEYCGRCGDHGCGSASRKGSFDCRDVKLFLLHGAFTRTVPTDAGHALLVDKWISFFPAGAGAIFQ
jgi:hypothetical protein